MQSRSDRERSFRRAILAGLVFSGIAHAAVLTAVRLNVDTSAETPREIRLFDLPETETNEPLEVIALREIPRAAQRVSPGGSAGGSPAAGEGSARRRAAPVFAAVPATLRGTIPDPRILLKKVSVPEKAENPVASYAEVSDFLVDASPNPRPLRPIDGRSVEELSAIAAGMGRRGVGVTVGGGYCPPGHDGGLRQAPVNRSIISPGITAAPFRSR